MSSRRWSTTFRIRCDEIRPDHEPDRNRRSIRRYVRESYTAVCRAELERAERCQDGRWCLDGAEIQFGVVRRAMEIGMQM